MAVNKPIAIGISIVLCVGVVIGVVAVVHHSNSKDKDNVSSQKKAVTNMCSSTSHQDTCEKTLSSANSEDPKELVSKAVSTTEEEIKKFFDHINSLLDKSKDNNQTKAALEVCKRLTDDAMDSLQRTLSEVKAADFTDFSALVNDLRTWLSMVVSFGESCLDGFDNSTSKDITRDTISKAMEKSSQLNTIALEIVSKLKEILPKFGINLDLMNLQSNKRRLLNSNDEYPEWFSTADRKLLAAAPPKPDAVVGPGEQYKTIKEAINAYPKGHQGRFTIYVKAGVYNEQIDILKATPNIFMYGDGPEKTKVTGSQSAKGTGIQTMQSASFGVGAMGFIAKDMGFENTAGWQGEQAVAFRSNADQTALFNCRFDGYQDTLYLQAGRQFYKGCTITGTLDFIFGDSPGVIQDSQIILRKPGPTQRNVICAPGRKQNAENSVLVIHKCKITAEPGLDKTVNPTFLARPWKQRGAAVFMENDYGDLIHPEGWMEWPGKPDFNKDCNFGEYNNRGPSADVKGRVKWPGAHSSMDKATASQYTVEKLLESKTPWLKETGIDFQPGLTA